MREVRLRAMFAMYQVTKGQVYMCARVHKTTSSTIILRDVFLANVLQMKSVFSALKSVIIEQGYVQHTGAGLSGQVIK